MTTPALKNLQAAIETTEFNVAPREIQKALVQEWAEIAISAFNNEPPEEWRLICVGEALTATLCGLYGLALRCLYDSTIDNEEVSPSFVRGIPADERARYTLSKLPEMLHFVASHPVQPHPVFGFRQPGFQQQVMPSPNPH